MKDESESTGQAKKILAERPEPIISNMDVVPYDGRMEPKDAVDALLEGYTVLIVDYYSSGLAILNTLKKHLKKKHTSKSFQEQRNFRSVFRDISLRLLLKVNKHSLTVKKAPAIGWFKILYPELTEFLLPFSQVQGLNSSWQWYKKGISIPVLNRKIHPWYGTYFPTRFEHLLLFDHWLKHYKGEKKSAIDIGIGSGILSFQMLNFGFEKVYGTDSNPNVIIGLNEDINKNALQSKLDLIHGDLFANCNVNSELIVFNPPWLPASYDLEGLDKAVYYEKNLFPRFFAEAKKHLNSDSKLVLLFSNLAQVTGVSDIHPIEMELSEGGRFRREYFVKKKVQAASKKTN
ncbi:MAG: methyltransferase, partial [Bacteroidales bacterium]|nr:methyltransferase [Bacteroidales bacterium]